MEHIFTVLGMTCAHCEKGVFQSIKQLDPQAQVLIDRAQSRVEVHSDLPRVALAQAMTEEGYPTT